MVSHTTQVDFDVVKKYYSIRDPCRATRDPCRATRDPCRATRDVQLEPTGIIKK